MFKKSFVVLAFPRTGSTLITHNLNRYFGISAIHTHKQDFVAPHEDCTCVITHRANVFDAICSHLVLFRTNEPVNYTNKAMDPFYVPSDEMWSLLQAHQTFHRSRNLSGYKKIVEIDFDQLLADPYHLFAQFNIVERTQYLTKPSPYRYNQLIENYDELQQVYTKFMEQQ